MYRKKYFFYHRSALCITLEISIKKENPREIANQTIYMQMFYILRSDKFNL